MSGTKIYTNREEGSRTFRPTVKIFPINDHNMTSVVRAMINVERYRTEGDVGALAFEPDERVEDYLRELSEKGAFEGIELEKAGHDILLVRYSQARKIPAFCLSRTNGYKDIKQIGKMLHDTDHRGLASVVETSDVLKFSKKFSDCGFELN